MKSVIACVVGVLAVSGAAVAQPDVNSAKLNTRIWNDFGGSTLTTTNSYPSIVQFNDSIPVDTSGYANRHNFRLSTDGGATNAQFVNGDKFSIFANVTLSGGGQGEGGLQLSPWWSPDTDGTFNLRTTDGEVACFGGRLPFYSFTASQGVTYVKGQTVRCGIEYMPNGLSMASPGQIRYTYDLGADGIGVLSSGWLNFDQGNAGEDPPHGLWGILNPAYVGGSTVVFGAASQGQSFVGTFENISYIPAPGAMSLLGLGGLLAARRRR